MNTDPDVDPTLLNKWKRNFDSWISNNADAIWIPVRPTLGSRVGNENVASNFNAALTRAQRVNQLQKAYIQATAAVMAPTHPNPPALCRRLVGRHRR